MPALDLDGARNQPSRQVMVYNSTEIAKYQAVATRVLTEAMNTLRGVLEHP
jgi:hypothetical protein